MNIFILDPICGTLGDHCGLTPVDPSKYRACCDDFKCRRYNDSGLGTCVKMHPAGSINFRSIFSLIKSYDNFSIQRAFMNNIILILFYIETVPSWNCSSCHDHKEKLLHEEENNSWGVYQGHQHSNCKDCKGKCEQDDKCAGVECYPKPFSNLQGRQGNLLSCLWRRERLSNECVYTDERYLTCWKNHNGSFDCSS